MAPFRYFNLPFGREDMSCTGFAPEIRVRQQNLKMVSDFTVEMTVLNGSLSRAQALSHRRGVWPLPDENKWIKTHHKFKPQPRHSALARKAFKADRTSATAKMLQAFIQSWDLEAYQTLCFMGDKVCLTYVSRIDLANADVVQPFPFSAGTSSQGLSQL
jgi:hypothetical protein